MKTIVTLILSLSLYWAGAQDCPYSIHFEQHEFYKQFGEQPATFYDSLDGFAGTTKSVYDNGCKLQRIVFGFHPYWAGSDYLDYQWNLISDLCYFSYEVDHATGLPVTYHDWLTDPAVDSALAHGVRVHLCATLFSGHTAFFTNPAARQTLITNLVSLMQQRNAGGINMDIEAMPSAMGDSVTAFMRDLWTQVKAVNPEALISIDLPAVNWGGDFDIAGLDPWIDFFFIMGYDYYWNGSSQAGPVSPLYTLTSSYNYSLSRTISDYESSGIKPDKFILGVPYYGRQWKTQSDAIPSPILANGTAMTYAAIKNSGGVYNPSNYVWEGNSFSSCYVFFQNDNWYQCFIGLDRDLRKKYDIVNYRNLAGIGIWALGYDDGYTELWQVISDKFTDCYIPLVYDTIFDSGGPTWNYYLSEDYRFTVDHGHNDSRYLTFTGFGLEDGYDSIWLWAGPDTTAIFLGGYSGQDLPGTFESDNGTFTLKFRSDGLTNYSGWKAVYHDGTMDLDENDELLIDEIHIFPNPARDMILVELPDSRKILHCKIYDVSGRVLFQKEVTFTNEYNSLLMNVSGWYAGMYFISAESEGGVKYSGKFIKLH